MCASMYVRVCMYICMCVLVSVCLDRSNVVLKQLGDFIPAGRSVNPLGSFLAVNDSYQHFKVYSSYRKIINSKKMAIILNADPPPK